jgi:MFS family permease
MVPATREGAIDSQTSTSPESDFRPVAAWATVAILMLFQFLSVIDRQIVAILANAIEADLGLTDVQLSLLQGLAFALFYSCVGIPIGIAVDRYSRRHVAWLAISFWSLSSAACGLATNFVGLFFGRMGVGAGEAGLTPVATSLITENFPRGRSATPMGLFAASFYAGAGLAFVLGGALVHWLSGLGPLSAPLIGAIKPWQAAFLITGLPGIVFALLAFLMHDPRDARRRASPAAARETMSFRALVASRPRLLFYFLVGWGILSAYSYAVAAWTPAFVMRVYGWDPAQVGFSIGLLIAGCGLTGCVIGGLVMDAMIRAGIKGAPFLFTAVVMGIALPFYIGAYLVGDPTWMLVLFGIAMFFAAPMGSGAYASLGVVAPPGARGKTAALFTFFMAMLGTAMGPFAAALITDYVLGDKARVGEALALFGCIVVPLGIALLLVGRKCYVAEEVKG